MKNLIDTYRLIPAGTPIWSIALQETISLSNDLIIQIKHTVYESDYVYAHRMMSLFNFPGVIPGIMRKGNDEIGVSLNQTQPWELPKPQFLDFSFNYPSNE